MKKKSIQVCLASLLLVQAMSAGAANCTLQAENYTTAFDTTAGNTGNVYRTDNVDIEATSDAGGGFNVGWTANG